MSDLETMILAYKAVYSELERYATTQPWKPYSEGFFSKTGKQLELSPHTESCVKAANEIIKRR